ncbi:MAG: EmrB/QacA family drug resistance transporter [Sphingomonas sp. SCN 67-18]|uniref:DHA2 family efflux MFS transporter permease subunit n=1 Tax=uncultured Sphingomonas sp. TaxID=158754 RepID=UPI00086F9333|nr:DHA2 family efflux MFS transporter permease subunit [Sphingomonas sp. SCN 67-18]ODU19617.1 MAG: EmrB/QacA family drug resistance transporter [Sphingomonas sp. SCN 67-18]
MASSALPHPGVPAIKVEQRGLLTLAVMLAMIMQILDTTIANVALPHMQASLGATLDTVTWVLTSYIVASAIAIPVTGWLSDRFGSRNLFLFAVGGFVVASALCGTAVNLEEMVAFRVLQGVCGAFISPLSQTVMLDINPPEKHARAMSIWGMGIMVGPVMGPVLGGWLTENYNWRWVFYVNVPFGIVTLALLWALLPSRPISRRSFDIFGFSMLAIGLAALQLVLDRGQGEDWFSSWEIRIEAGVAIAALWLATVHLVTGKKILFNRSLFADRNLVTGMLFMIVIGVTTMAPMALLPPMLQQLYDYPVLDTGLLLAPRGIGVFITMAVSGQMMGRGVDPRWLVGTGMIIFAWSLWLMTQWSLDMSWGPVVTSGFIQGIGMGLVFIPLQTIAFSTLTPAQRTDGASLMNLFRNLGASIGISAVTTMLARNLQISHADVGQHITAGSLSALNLANAEGLGGIGQGAMAMVNAEVTRQALMIAYLDDFYLMLILITIAFPLLFLLKKPAGRMPASAPME